MRHDLWEVVSGLVLLFGRSQHVSELDDHDEPIAFAVETACIKLNVEARTILLLVSGDACVDRCFADDGNPRC